MSKIQKHIEIVRSSINYLSSMSQKSADALVEVLSKHYQTVGVTIIDSEADLAQIVTASPDLVFIGMKFVPGLNSNEKIWLTTFLKQNNIAHTGSPREAIELEQHKALAKQCILNSNLQTSPYFVSENSSDFAQVTISLSYPLFIKPTSLGAGRGIDELSVVHGYEQALEKIDLLTNDGRSDALIEEYLSGREFSVAVIHDSSTGELRAMPIELLPAADVNGDYMLSYKLKSSKLETPVAVVADGKLRNQLKNLAIKSFQALGARDYGRIDIRLDKNGVPNFLEANLIPCIIEGSGNFPKACLLNSGMDYEEMIMTIVNLGLDRAYNMDSKSIEDTANLAPIDSPITGLLSSNRL